MPEFTNPFAGNKNDRKLTKEELIRAIRFDIAAEYEATQLYVQLAESTDDKVAKAVLMDVADEEIVHAGEFLRLLTTDPFWIILGFWAQSLFAGAMYSQLPSYLTERFPTEVRATASAFTYHTGAIAGGLVAPVLTYLAVQMNFGFAMPMMISTILFLVLVVISVLLGPETKGKSLEAIEKELVD